MNLMLLMDGLLSGSEKDWKNISGEGNENYIYFEPQS